MGRCHIQKKLLYFEKIRELLKFHLLAIKHSFELEKRQDYSAHIKTNDILLFATMKNETFRLPYFLDYYRNLGVNHFIFVDNDSDDGIMKVLKKQKDITVFYTKKSYKDANYGMHWLNFLLKKYGSGHWCITCDPDEFLLFPYMDSRNLYELTYHLDSNYKKSFFAPLIDMYSNKSIEETYYKPGDDPIDICPYFDQIGYIAFDSTKYHLQVIKGGVRKRVFNSENPEKSPLLTKTPLIKWKKQYAYIASTHIAIPQILNKSNNPNLTTGALLHFKFMNTLLNKIAIEMKEKQHCDNSYEYKQYSKTINAQKHLYNKDISVKYENWSTLVNLGLMNRGEW